MHLLLTTGAAQTWTPLQIYLAWKQSPKEEALLFPCVDYSKQLGHIYSNALSQSPHDGALKGFPTALNDVFANPQKATTELWKIPFSVMRIRVITFKM